MPKGKKAQKQPILLIKYLLARGGNNIPEHEIQDTLWPESDGDAAQNSYSTTLHRTRKLLSNKNALIHSNGRLSFNDTMVWTDTALFDHYLERIHSKINGLWIQKDPRKGNTSAVRLLEDLSALFSVYRGPFLAGDQEAWILPRAEVLKSKFTDLLETTARVLELHHFHEEAVQCYKEGTQLSGFN